MKRLYSYLSLDELHTLFHLSKLIYLNIDFYSLVVFIYQAKKYSVMPLKLWINRFFMLKIFEKNKAHSNKLTITYWNLLKLHFDKNFNFFDRQNHTKYNEVNAMNFQSFFQGLFLLKFYFILKKLWMMSKLIRVTIIFILFFINLCRKWIKHSKIPLLVRSNIFV